MKEGFVLSRCMIPVWGKERSMKLACTECLLWTALYRPCGNLDPGNSAAGGPTCAHVTGEETESRDIADGPKFT